VTSLVFLVLLSQFVFVENSKAAVLTATGTDPSVCNQNISTLTGVTAVRLAEGVCVIQFTGASESFVWTVPNNISSVSYLVVGGGGAGGTVQAGSSGGGGGGEVLASTIDTTNISNLTMIVGLGGTPSATAVGETRSGGDGQSSSITPNAGTVITARGGGGGAHARDYRESPLGAASTTGFTGGGGSAHASPTGSQLTGSTGAGGISYKGGNANGNSTTGPSQTGGGGGGAGGAGGNGSASSGGTGGTGISSNLTGSTNFYGGGGGGARRSATGGGTATGGGGAGGNNGVGEAGTVNTGGGGGGSANPNVGTYGGSGFIVLRYSPSAPSAPTLNSITSGDRSVTVNFTANSIEEAAITDYEYSLNGGSYVSAGTTTSPFTITGLSGRTAYSVTLKARNSVGLSTASSSLSATTTDASLDASEAAAAEAARVAAANAEAARVAAANAEAARVAAAKQQKELTEILSLIPELGKLSLNIGETSKALTGTKCVKGKTIKYVFKGKKCPKGFVKRK